MDNPNLFREAPPLGDCDFSQMALPPQPQLPSAPTGRGRNTPTFDTQNFIVEINSVLRGHSKIAAFIEVSGFAIDPKLMQKMVMDFNLCKNSQEIVERDREWALRIDGMSYERNISFFSQMQDAVNILLKQADTLSGYTRNSKIELGDLCSTSQAVEKSTNSAIVNLMSLVEQLYHIPIAQRRISPVAEEI